jgi:hypothetical protein
MSDLGKYIAKRSKARDSYQKLRVSPWLKSMYAPALCPLLRFLPNMRNMY